MGRFNKIKQWLREFPREGRGGYRQGGVIEGSGQERALMSEHRLRVEDEGAGEDARVRYLEGQRVIVSNSIIATFIGYENAGLVTEALWVRLPDGVERWQAPHNVSPLPGGQL